MVESTLIDSFTGLESSVCPLLSLPGELRNRIYDYCVESGPVALPPALHAQSPSRPLFGGLRHASKLLYVEFTPLYLRRTMVLIHSSNPGGYISAVYPKQRTLPNDDNRVTGSSPNTHGQMKIHVRLGEVLDLTPFAGLMARAPHTRVEFAFTFAIRPVIENMADLLRRIMDASCSIDFENIVEGILFRCSLRSQVVFKLHRHVLLKDLFEGITIRNPRNYLIQQGLADLNSLEVVMETSEGVVRDPPTHRVFQEKPGNRLRFYQKIDSHVSVSQSAREGIL
ncbi:hypothetical protein SVAN01_09547 [Stagonosporopsis vannaccii]|nr:hypothetical protein SVAN01_09547 [Stagonosporopsis vannaccii]